jgi:hypothetical protein
MLKIADICSNCEAVVTVQAQHLFFSTIPSEIIKIDVGKVDD